MCIKPSSRDHHSSTVAFAQFRRDLGNVAGILPFVRVAVRSIGDFDYSEVTPEEKAIAASFTVRRKNEFLTGRACARAAALPVALPSVVRTTSGAPDWPPGVTGSISHDNSLAIAAVAINSPSVAIGIDIEAAHHVEPSLLPIICTPAERDAIERLKPCQVQQRTAAVFTLKEAFYKAQFSITGEWLEFHDIEIHFVKSGALIVPVKPETAIIQRDWSITSIAAFLKGTQVALVAICPRAAF